MNSPSGPNHIGRDDLIELLSLSECVDLTHVRNSGDAPYGAFLAASVIRCRRLARAALFLLDEKLELEAEILTRSLSETAIGIAWILRDENPRLRIERFRLKDLDSRVRLLEEIVSAQERDDGITEDIPTLVPMREERDALALQLKRPPDLRQQAKEAGYAIGYLDFQYSSERRTHFRLLALEPFMVDRVEGEDWIVDAAGSRTRLDSQPYETAAIWIVVALKEVAMSFPKQFPWQEAVIAVEERITSGIQARS